MGRYATVRTIRYIAALAVAVLALTACAGMNGVAVKRPAPDFNVKLLGGGDASLAEFRGKPLVLVIGASWCPHCIHEVPELVEAHEAYKDRVNFLSVFIKSEPDEVKDLVVEHKVEYKVAIDKEAVIGKAYGVKGIPVTLFIDSNGVITDEYLGGMTKSGLSSRIEALLAVPEKPAD